jgi:hypothetical protein
MACQVLLPWSKLVRRDEVTEGWRKLHSEELYNLYSSPNIFRIFKSCMMKWAVHLSEGEVCTKFLEEILKSEYYLEDIDIGGKITLKHPVE